MANRRERERVEDVIEIERRRLDAIDNIRLVFIVKKIYIVAFL